MNLLKWLLDKTGKEKLELCEDLPQVDMPKVNFPQSTMSLSATDQDHLEVQNEDLNEADYDNFNSGN